MIKLLPTVAVALLFSSCVTIFNRGNTLLKIKSSKGAWVIYRKEYTGVKTERGIIQPHNGDPIPITRRKGVYIIARRSGTESLPVTVTKDGMEKTMLVKPVHSYMYYANFAHIFPAPSFGFLLDHKNSNRFTYPHTVYVNMDDTADKRYYFFKPVKIPYLELAITPPLGNLFVYKLSNLDQAASPWGLCLGLNYHYNYHRFLSFEAGVAAITPLYGHYRDSVTMFQYGPPRYEKKSGWFVSLKNNYAAGRYEFGYGLFFGEHFGKRFYGRWKTGDSTASDQHNFGIGGSFSAHYRIARYLSGGINYQPQLFSIDRAAAFNYEHYVSMGITWYLQLSSSKK